MASATAVVTGRPDDPVEPAPGRLTRSLHAAQVDCQRMACAALSELGAALSWSPYSEDAQSEAIGLSDEFSMHLQRSFEQKMGGRTADASKLRRQADSFAKGCVAFLSESAAWTRWRSPCSSDFAQLLNDQEAALRADRARLELQRAAEVGSGPAAAVTAANRTVPSQCALRFAHITLTFALALHGMARMLHSVRFALLQVACASQPPPVRAWALDCRSG